MMGLPVFFSTRLTIMDGGSLIGLRDAVYFDKIDLPPRVEFRDRIVVGLTRGVMSYAIVVMVPPTGVAGVGGLRSAII